MIHNDLEKRKASLRTASSSTINEASVAIGFLILTPVLKLHF